MKEMTRKIKVRLVRPGLIPALASPHRIRDYAEYLQNPNAPHMNSLCKTQKGVKRFCQESCRPKRILSRLKTLSDSCQWDCQEYRDHERDENKLNISLRC